MATATIEAHRHATAYTRLQLRHSVMCRDSCRRSAGIGCSFTRFANDHRFHSRVIDCLGSVTFERDAKSGSPSDRIHTRFFETHAFPCADEAGINRLVRRGLRRTWRLVFIRTSHRLLRRFRTNCREFIFVAQRVLVLKCFDLIRRFL